MTSTPKGPKAPIANFRTYEAQARLLAAVIATAKPKLNFTAIAKHIGSDASPHSVDHRLRPMKQLARLQAKYVEEGKDPADLPVDKAEIHKLFGESTPGGLEFHFREAKATGLAQQDAVKAGEDPTRVPVGPQTRHVAAAAKAKARGQNSVPSTPSTSRKRNALKSGAATTGGRVRKQQRIHDLTEDDVDSIEEDFDELDQDTPSKHFPRSARNPAYAVNNSTTNSETDLTLPTPRPYAQVQRENQARARAEFRGTDSHGQPYGSSTGFGAESSHHSEPRMNNHATHHQSNFEASSQTWTTAPANASFYSDSQARNNDEFQILDDPQFSFPNPNRNHTGNGGGNRAPVPDFAGIKKDPFETSGTDSDVVDLTQPPGHDQALGRVAQPVLSYSQDSNQGWKMPPHSYQYDDGDYGDGEI
ncbi:hypothetical protein BKA67DRAFT_232208 [Truncatella angustata]|uniref:Uncharacterized protein n=1 Tax=Truncatella angustata TaxID=152316 RepID=A0A9P8UN65_9PEZI|nr:uncharacterized protein BKA67DRAFT_232208 [Truncatella angustata]KAH6655277.1 hypothetical protein BKA67DRAFT_232208 [Truncatella angustata]KAH8200278.1 hypothetical protein TruAng_005551 [Truncatella angustata]